jgi:hypothetical protein
MKTGYDSAGQYAKTQSDPEGVMAAVIMAVVSVVTIGMTATSGPGNGRHRRDRKSDCDHYN